MQSRDGELRTLGKLRPEQPFPCLRAEVTRPLQSEKLLEERMLSRDETLLLKATGTSSEMPGGMVRLIHYSEYKTNFQNVQYKYNSSCACT
jgi:hypothetical protein